MPNIIKSELAAHTGDDGCLTIGKHDHEELRASYERVAEAVREEIRELIRNINVRNPEQVNEGFILGFSNCRQRVELALTPPPTETEPTPLPE